MTTLRQHWQPAYPGGPITPVVMEVQDDGTEKPSGGGRVKNTPAGQFRADPDGPFCSVEVRPAGASRRSWLLRWQWRVTDFDLLEGQHPGVFNRWLHIGATGGYAPFRWLACLRAGRIATRATW